MKSEEILNFHKRKNTKIIIIIGITFQKKNTLKCNNKLNSILLSDYTLIIVITKVRNLYSKLSISIMESNRLK